MEEQATLGGGCFWCLEAVYKEMVGVKTVVSGYAAGAVPNPTYEQVCSGRSGHAEVVQVTYDPREVSYSDVLEVFWDLHDPTTLNRQGNDYGSQYRSIILTHNDAQRQIAEASRAEAQKAHRDPIVTQIDPLTVFYPAEAYHQDFFENHPTNGYCRVVVSPKVAKFRQHHADRVKRT